MFSRKGQSTIEYTLMIAVVIGSILWVLQKQLYPAIKNHYGKEIVGKIATQSSKLGNTFKDTGDENPDPASYKGLGKAFIASTDPVTLPQHPTSDGFAITHDEPIWGAGTTDPSDDAAKTLIDKDVQVSLDKMDEVNAGGVK